MFPTDLRAQTERIIELMRRKGLRLVSAESCTGGLIAALFTEVPGSSDVFERGFITYSNDAKIEAIGVSKGVLDRHGAVSAAVALAMAEGALKHAPAAVAVAVTGIAGPAGGTEQKPVGLVYIAVEKKGEAASVQRFTFGDIGRGAVRLASVKEALGMIEGSVA